MNSDLKDKNIKVFHLDQTKHVDINEAIMMVYPTGQNEVTGDPGTSKGSFVIHTSNFNEESNINLQNIPTNDRLDLISGKCENENKLNCNKRKVFEDSPRTSISHGEMKIDETLQNNSIKIQEKKIISLDKNCSQKIADPLQKVDMQLPKRQRQKVNVFTNDSLPQWYHVRGTLVTLPILPKNLPKAFEGLPIYGKPKSKAELERFQSEKLREFMGCDLDDEEFDELSKYCSPEHLKTGNELSSKTSVPTPGIFPLMETPKLDDNVDLNILKKCKLRVEQDHTNKYTTKLKYRAVRLIPKSQEDNTVVSSEPQLEPGRDILYHVRLYRPYTYCLQKERLIRGRHSVFSYDIMLSGRQCLTVLRDRIVCNNDLDMRVDVSNTPDVLPVTTSKDVFPSGFLFINNVFYVDTRDGCVDHSAVIREWAIRRGMGHYTKKDMCKVRLDDLVVKLGYPEVYMHQGNCEHVFTFSEIRLVTSRDPLRLAQYPYVPSISQNQTIYCTTCAEFGAKWIVVGCRSVPFDPAFFCDMCFKQYMYKDGRKIGEFKAYTYRGNEINMLKPQG